MDIRIHDFPGIVRQPWQILIPMRTKNGEDANMEAENLWRCFLETGAPEYYLLYKAAKADRPHELEAADVVTQL